ncbi:Pfam:DUF231 [Seminavis robusta]|uniref:Pfam:DUF231 n=1 Tax=Seminavis robusta TaxID=568900 RepID=A0A9N8EXX3_9STRA|nr:Pfam:DUF231 [Seminavis robusta]|eukprot:Sro2019_g311300.1 Pfam:DUF231 (459) ;mRNA; r:4332-5708
MPSLLRKRRKRKKALLESGHGSRRWRPSLALVVVSASLLTSFREHPALHSVRHRFAMLAPTATGSHDDVRNQTALSANQAIETTEQQSPSTSSSTQRLCTSEELRRGEWRPSILDRPPFIPSHSKCYTQEYLKQVTSWTDYRWYPFASHAYHQQSSSGDSCQFEPQFSNHEFCRVSHNKTIGFFGDSLTWEHFSSLAARFQIAVGAHDQMRFTTDDGIEHDQQKGMIFDICHGQSKIAFFRNRYMMYVDHFLAKYSIDVLVINGGAHYMKDTDLIDGFSNRPNTTGIKWIVKELAKHHQQRQGQGQGDSFLTIWRTTSPGHHQCWNFTKPVNNLTQMEEYIQYSKERYPGKMGQYGWWDFKRQTQLVLQEFQNYNNNQQQDKKDAKLNFQIMHGYDVNILRPDGHVGTIVNRSQDCLHSCDPGPADVYNILLLHLLRLEQDKRGKASIGASYTGATYF